MVVVECGPHNPWYAILTSSSEWCVLGGLIDRFISTRQCKILITNRIISYHTRCVLVWVENKKKLGHISILLAMAGINILLVFHSHAVSFSVEYIGMALHRVSFDSHWQTLMYRFTLTRAPTVYGRSGAPKNILYSFDGLVSLSLSLLGSKTAG